MGRSALGGGGINLPWSADGQVRQRLARGPPQYTKVAAGLGPNREATEEGGGLPCGVGYLLHSSGPSSSTLWFRNMGDIGGYGKESGVIPNGLPLEGLGEDIDVAVGWYVEKGGGVECYQVNRETYFGGYINCKQTTLAEWVVLRPIYEVYEKEMEYDRGGRYREPWWSQTAPRAQLRDTIENILAAARAH